MDTIMRDMDRIWSEIFPAPSGFIRTRKPHTERAESRVIAPALDMIDLEDSILVRVDMPGVKKKEIVITIDDGKLNIKTEPDGKEEHKSEYYYHMERSKRPFARQVALPIKIDEENIGASLRDGILEITLPKAEEAMPRKIKVEVL